ncbi:MAG: PIG-L family deacetylase [Clostridia bacterium]|nr:PIG-L family deacetylase [Clostridia bacterium]
MRSRIIKLTVVLSLLFILTLTASAEEITQSVTLEGITVSSVTDGALSTHALSREIAVKSDKPIHAIYLIYNKASDGGLLNGEAPIAQHGFLHELIEVDGLNELKLTYNTDADLCDIRVFGEGELPEDIERWETAPEGVDLLLLATHSDDDQLFFAGLLPRYASIEGVRVAVAYFANHYDTYNRTHELLQGLWHCGVKYYPEISPFPDGYSESVDGAKAFLSSRGVTDGDVQAFHEMLLERYKPLVVVLHDFKGEYGHGAHMHSTQSFIETLESVGETSVEKVYVHLYEENSLVLDIDSPLEAFDGKTAFQVSQEAFNYHKSQHWTWFYSWIYGKSTPITSSTQISSYNPAHFGLYYTTVGKDELGGDMLENVVTYAEREKPVEPEITEPEIVEPEITEPEEISKEEPTTIQSETEAELPVWIIAVVFLIIIVILIIITARRKKCRTFVL